jgi:hypothetical protein
VPFPDPASFPVAEELTDLDAPEAEAAPERRCTVCDVKLSTYNPGPNCWSHTIGQPWRGPTAKPKLD